MEYLTNGTYSAYAIAYDNGGNATTSAPVSFTVSVSPPPPTLTLSTQNSGNLQLQVAGAPGFNYTLQASTNLQTWTNMLTTNPAVMPFLWTESNRTLFPTRFYRAIIGP